MSLKIWLINCWVRTLTEACFLQLSNCSAKHSCINRETEASCPRSNRQCHHWQSIPYLASKSLTKRYTFSSSADASCFFLASRPHLSCYFSEAFARMRKQPLGIWLTLEVNDYQLKQNTCLHVAIIRGSSLTSAGPPARCLEGVFTSCAAY